MYANSKFNPWHTEKLEAVLECERQNIDVAADLRGMDLPFHYNSIAHVLLLQCVLASKLNSCLHDRLTTANVRPACNVYLHTGSSYLIVCILSLRTCSAADDVTTAGGHSEVHDCRRLLRDIEDVRSSKIRKGTKLVMEHVKKSDHVHEVSKMINFRNLVFAELNQVRPTLKLALDTLEDINPREVTIRLLY